MDFLPPEVVGSPGVTFRPMAIGSGLATGNGAGTWGVGSAACAGGPRRNGSLSRLQAVKFSEVNFQMDFLSGFFKIVLRVHVKWIGECDFKRL